MNLTLETSFFVSQGTRSSLLSSGGARLGSARLDLISILSLIDFV